MVYGPLYEAMALNRALSQDYTGTHDYLALAIEVGWRNYYWIVNDPIWKKVIEEADISSLLAGVHEELVAQGRALAATDAQHDFRAEIEILAGEAQSE